MPSSWPCSAPRLVDPVEQAAVGKMGLLGLRPSAEVGDGEQVELRKMPRVALRYLREPRAEVIACRDLLGFRRVEEGEIGLGDLARAPGSPHRDGRRSNAPPHARLL